MIVKIPMMDDANIINSRVTGMELAAVRQSVQIGLLDSALRAPLAGFGDTDLYPHDHQRLAVLCSRIVLNHPFLDGNKRTGFLLMLRAAHLADIDLKFPDQNEVSDRIAALAAGELDEDRFADYINGRLGRE